MKMIYVFSSNLAGYHNSGEALEAVQNYGAQNGVSIGKTGDSYAIPIKSSTFTLLSLSTIKSYVIQFLNYAQQHPELQFHITRIGCGLPGYREIDIIPMFKDSPSNCCLPGGWYDSKENW